MTQKERFRRHIEPITRNLLIAAYRFTGNRFDAEDLAQETLVKAFKNMEKFKEGTSAKAWTFTILKNTFYNNVRYQKRREVPLLDPNDIDGYKDESIQEIGAAGLDDEMQSIIDSLPEEMRLILIAREIQGLDYNQIAEDFSVPLGTVKSRIKRAREKLRELWLKNHDKK